MTKILALAPPPSRKSAPEACKPPWVDIYSVEIGQRICDLTAAGKTLAQIAKEAWCPMVRQVHLWMTEYPEFRQDYEQARKIAADLLAREVVELADKASTELEMARLPFQIQTREWVAARMDPAKYGDKRMIETHSQVNVRSVSVSKIDVSHLSMEEIRIAEKALRKAIQGPDEASGNDEEED